MIIKRDKYLEKLISQKDKDMIKVVTGLRRSGKSFLLFELFYNYLKSSGVNEDQIIRINLDEERSKNLRDAEAMYSEIRSRIKSDSVRYYILLDELQYAITRDELRDKSRPLRIYDLLNSLMHIKMLMYTLPGAIPNFFQKML